MLKKLNLLKSNQGFMRYFANTSWLFFERLIKMAINFFVIILFTRYLGPEQFGLLSYAQSYVGIFTAFATLGIDIIIVRELTKHREFNDKLLGTGFILKLTASVFAILLIFVFNGYMNDQKAVLFTNIIAFTLLFQSINIIDTFFQAEVLSKYSAIANSITFVFSSVFKITLIYFEADLIYFVYALVIDSLVIAFGYLYIYILQKRNILLWKFDKTTASYLLKNGWPLTFVAMAAFIYTRTDQVMLKYLVGNGAVGNYTAATKVSELFYFISLLITQSVFPKIVQVKHEKSQVEYFNLLEKIFRLIVWSAIPISLILFIFSKEIAAILYGEQFSLTSEVLSILAFGVLLNAVGTFTTKILYVEQYEKKYLYRSILGIITNVILNYWLINLYGVQGAAISTIITLFIIYYIYDIFDKDLRKFYYMKWKCFIPIR